MYTYYVFASPSVHPRFFGGVRVAHIYSFYFCVVFLFRVRCCDVRHDFCIMTMFGGSVPPVVYRRTHILFTLFLFVFSYSGVQHILCCVFVLFFFVLCTLCCQVFMDCHYLIAPSVFSNVHLLYT